MRKVKAIPGNLPLFPAESNWKAPSLSDLPSWKNCRRAALDTEFDDPTLVDLGCGARRNAKIAGYSFMLEGDRPYYIPLRHPEGNVDCDQGLNYLRDQVGGHEGSLVMANGTGDLDILEVTENIKPDYNRVQIRDVQIQQALIWELDFKYNLEACAQRHNVPGKDKELLKLVAQSYGYDIARRDWMRCIPHLPAKYIGPYGEADASCMLPIDDAQWVIAEKQGLTEVFGLESQILPIALKMRQRGIRLDMGHLDKVEEWAKEEELKALAAIKDITGYDIGVDNCMSAEIVAPALRYLGLTIPLTDGDKPKLSITSGWLESIAATKCKDYEVAEHIHYLRQVNKLRNTFVQSIRTYQTKGRIHATFKQIVGSTDNNEKEGAAFGRFSCVDPNMQQQPSREEFAPFWRKIYLPEEGALWLSSDFSAQEPRWTVHYADLLGLRGSKDLADRYRNEPRIDPHQAMADITGLKRSDAKTVFLALCYNMGGVKLCKESLGLPTRFLVETEDRKKHYFKTNKQALSFRHQYRGRCKIREVAGEEGQAIIDKFHEGAPFLRELIKRVTDKIESTGVLKILGGRHIHFPTKEDGSFDWAHKGLNRLIQGTSGYHMKKALIAIVNDCPEFFLQGTFHDEAGGSIFELSTAKKVSGIMRDCVKARVPFRVECEVGPSLGELKVLCNVGNCLNYAVPWDKPKNFGCEQHAVGCKAA